MFFPWNLKFFKLSQKEIWYYLIAPYVFVFLFEGKEGEHGGIIGGKTFEFEIFYDWLRLRSSSIYFWNTWLFYKPKNKIKWPCQLEQQYSIWFICIEM